MKDERLLQLLMLMKAIDDEEDRFSLARTEHKDTMQKLQSALRILRYEVVSGQHVLPIDGVLETVADLVNAGALDKDGIKCTAEVSK
jgi:hypothetical protein